MGVASLDHVQNAVAGGFCQFNHGLEAPLKRLTAHDWIVYYSPKYSLHSTNALQAFTAAGQVVDSLIWQSHENETFQPFRRDVAYSQVDIAPIRPLLGALPFITDEKAWGSLFRRGFFEIDREDFGIIVQAMNIQPRDWQS